jgi:hypothetical protein
MVDEGRCEYRDDRGRQCFHDKGHPGHENVGVCCWCKRPVDLSDRSNPAFGNGHGALIHTVHIRSLAAQVLQMDVDKMHLAQQAEAPF